MTRICLIGNCQAQHLEMMFEVAGSGVTVHRLQPVFMLGPDHRAALDGAIASCDLVFAQRVSDSFWLEYLTTRRLKRDFGAKVVTWPVIYFDGVFPGVEYIYLPSRGKLVGPLGDYHFRQIRYAHRLGLPVTRAVDAFAEDGLLQGMGNEDPIGESIAKLRLRERDTELTISDRVADGVGRERQFYTPNHPTNALLGDMLQRMGDRGGIGVDREAAVAAPYRLDALRISAAPAIVRRHALPYDPQPVYRGQTVAAVTQDAVTLGEYRDYSAVELAEAFYRLYDVTGTV